MEIVLIIMCFFIAVLIHEIGHSIPLLLNKGKITLFAIGPLLYEENKFKLNKNLNLVGGAIYVIPPENTTISNREYIKTIYFGPLLSVILFFVSLSIYYLTTFEVFLFISIMSLGVFLGSIIPLKNTIAVNSYTDGRRLINAYKNNVTHAIEYHIYNLSNKFDKQLCYDLLSNYEINNEQRFIILYIMVENLKELNEQEIEQINKNLYSSYVNLNKKMKKYLQNDEVILNLEKSLNINIFERR